MTRGTSGRTKSRMSREAPAEPQRRGILGGAVLLAIGLAFFLPPLGVPNAGAYLFVALGIAFAAAWWVGARRQYVYLVPACVLIGFGLARVIAERRSFSPGSSRSSRSPISSCRSIWSRSRCSRISSRWSLSSWASTYSWSTGRAPEGVGV